MSGLLLGIVLSVCTCWFHNMVTLPPRLVSTDFGACSYKCFLSSCTPVYLHMLKCSCAHTLSCRFMYCSFASIGHADIMWSILLLLLLLLLLLCIWENSPLGITYRKTTSFRPAIRLLSTKRSLLTQLFVYRLVVADTQLQQLSLLCVLRSVNFHYGFLRI